jgi:hypothetical protein
MTIQTEKTTQIKDEIQIIRTRIPTENYGFWLGFGLWYIAPPSSNISVISWRSVLLVEERVWIVISFVCP